MTFMFLILLLGITAMLGISSVSTMNTILSEMLDGPVSRLQLTQELKIEELQQIRQQKNLLLAQTPEETKTALDQINQARSAYDKAFSTVLSKATEEGEATWNKLSALSQEFRKQDDAIQAYVQAGNTAAALKISNGDNRKVIAGMDELLAQITALEQGRLKAADVATDVEYAHTRLILVSLAAGAAVISIIAALWIVMSISKGIHSAVSSVRKVSEGDLTEFAEIKTRDEIGELLGFVNSMIERLRGVAGDALTASDYVSSGSQQLSSASEQ
ncbi:MCP four helix bundle domain-containing protein, partial [Allorhizobium sonneratiae]|uniref:MCP four helix bundle domain-containing protein n=1 Tax=Allorhizobium sonneratiae TaxID=2934936 RepID=UPI00203389DD